MNAETVWTSGTVNAVAYTVEYDDADDFATPLGAVARPAADGIGRNKRWGGCQR